MPAITASDFQQIHDLLNDFCQKPASQLCSIISSDAPLQDDLSIIIPCYNEEKYISFCLEQIVHYPFSKKVSIIIIDDGSTDGSAKIIDSYASFPNVHIIHQENKGFSGARNAGISESMAKYVFLQDADDLVRPECLEAMLDTAISNDADLVEAHIFNVDESCEKLPPIAPSSEISCEKIPRTSISGYAGGKLIRKSFFEKLSFPEGYMFEDGIVSLLIAPMCRSTFCCMEDAYAYRMNYNGITANIQKSKKALHGYWMLEFALEAMERLGIEKSDELYDEILSWISMNYVRIRYFDPGIKTAVFFATAYILDDWNRHANVTNRYKAVLQKALLSSDPDLYGQCCELVYNSILC